MSRPVKFLLLGSLGAVLLAVFVFNFRQKPSTNPCTAVALEVFETRLEGKSKTRFLEMDVDDPQGLIAKLLRPLYSDSCNWTGFPEIEKQVSIIVSECEQPLTDVGMSESDLFESSFFCLKEWMRLRSMLAVAFKDSLNTKSRRIAVLEAQLFPALFNESDLNARQIFKITEDLLRLYPKGEPKKNIVRQYALQSLYRDWTAALATDSSQSKEKILETAIEDFEKEDPENPVLIEVKLSRLKQKNDAQQFYKLALEEKRKAYFSPVADYYLAWASHEMGKQEASLWHLGMAIAARPDDPRSQQTFAALNSSRSIASDSIFRTDAGVYSGVSFRRNTR